MLERQMPKVGEVWDLSWKQRAKNEECSTILIIDSDFAITKEFEFAFYKILGIEENSFLIFSFDYKTLKCNETGFKHTFLEKKSADQSKEKFRLIPNPEFKEQNENF